MKKRWKATIVSLMFMTVSYGCETETRYKVLSFFFDGVPGSERSTPSINSEEKNRYTEHGPYAARLCEGCHHRGSNRLIAPVEELCFYCHTVAVEKKWVHGPVASGGCRVCHNPHSSPYRFLLVSDSKEFCFQCHDKNAILSGGVHSGIEAACTDCHHAHMSDSRFLLK